MEEERRLYVCYGVFFTGSMFVQQECAAARKRCAVPCLHGAHADMLGRQAAAGVRWQCNGPLTEAARMVGMSHQKRRGSCMRGKEAVCCGRGRQCCSAHAHVTSPPAI